MMSLIYKIRLGFTEMRMINGKWRFLKKENTYLSFSIDIVQKLPLYILIFELA